MSLIIPIITIEIPVTFSVTDIASFVKVCIIDWMCRHGYNSSYSQHTKAVFQYKNCMSLHTVVMTHGIRLFRELYDYEHC